MTPLQQTAFWKHSDKRRNCTKRAIAPFATMFSTFCHRLSIQLWRFSMFWQNTFKVVCCRIVVWGKGLILFPHIQLSYFHLQRVSIFFRVCFQSRLLCCIRESVSLVYPFPTCSLLFTSLQRTTLLNNITKIKLSMFLSSQCIPLYAIHYFHQERFSIYLKAKLDV